MRAFVISSRDIERCPAHSLRPQHYREDGSCHCPVRAKCGHLAWSMDGHCAEMVCRNYVNKCPFHAVTGRDRPERGCSLNEQSAQPSAPPAKSP